MSELRDQHPDSADGDALERTDDRPWPNHPKYLGPTGMFTGSIDELSDEQVENMATEHLRRYPRHSLIFEPADATSPAQQAATDASGADGGTPPTDHTGGADDLAPDPDQPSPGPDDLPSESGDPSSESSDPPPDSSDLDRPVSDQPGAPTIRQVLERFAGPDGLTAQQQQDDESYVAAHGDQRPWLRISDEPLVRHVYCERDRQGGHDPARHDAWGDAETQRARAEHLKDPGHATDSPAYHNSVEALKGQPPPDNIGGKGKQHDCGELTTRINDPTIWAAATARILEHPRVKEALASSDAPPSVKNIPISDILGANGHRYCDGYSLITHKFDTPRDGVDNRRHWVQEVRKVEKETEDPDRAGAEARVEERSARGDIPWVKPQVEAIGNFEHGTFQVNLRKRAGTIEISTIFVNPPAIDD